MKRRFLVLATILSGIAAALAQQQQMPQPPRDSGQGITPAYEGYFENPDGSLSILFGYYNRNLKQTFDIPVGAENRIEPGGPDRGQPTHFVTGRQWGLFTVSVPKEFNQKLTWTLTANGKTATVPANLDPLYLLAPFQDATNNTPPFIGFAAAGPFVNGPVGHSTKLQTTLPNPARIELWLAEDAVSRRAAATPVTVTLNKYRGPGTVAFTPQRPPATKAEFKGPGGAKFTGQATATASFSEPGEYILHVVANDATGAGGGGFQCCWSNAQIHVSVSSSR
jgi:hypothetical protein